MSDPRYRVGVLQGIKLSTTPGDWPSSVPGVGDFRGGQPLGSCQHCTPDAPPSARMTFVKYGDAYLCKRHALDQDPPKPPGERARDLGLAQVVDNSGDFTERALAFLAGHTPAHAGETLTGEGLRHLLEGAGITPHDPHGWGALVMLAIKRELLLDTERREPMRDTDSHARKTPIYRLMVGSG